MTTLLQVGFRRCDSRCHYAYSLPGDCQCICEGENHGAGIAGTLPQRDLPLEDVPEKRWIYFTIMRWLALLLS